MKCFIVLVAVAVCSADQLRFRRNPSWDHHHHHSGNVIGFGGSSGAASLGSAVSAGSFAASGAGHQQQRFRLTADGYGDGPCGASGPALIPEREPIVVEQTAPLPYQVNFGAQPKVIEHEADLPEIDYFEKPTVVNHQKQTRLNVFPQQPVVLDGFEEPLVSEVSGPSVISVQQVAPSAGGAGGLGGAGGQGYGFGGNQGVVVGGSQGFAYPGSNGGIVLPGGQGGVVFPGGYPGHEVHDHPGHLEPAPKPCPPPCP